MGCSSCGRGFHAECLRGCKKCHPREHKDKTTENGSVQRKSRKSKVHGLKDEKSTGRKRAAQLYPIDPEAPCEWQKKKNCGGGRRPIVGCLNGKQVDRHHGPVKKTTRNEEGNVHRICKDCHNHWHELNDLVYDEAAYNNLPHDPVAATDMEIAEVFLKWQSGEMGKLFELASSKNREKGRAKNLLSE